MTPFSAESPRRDRVRHETLANLSALPEQAAAAIEATLKGSTWCRPGRR